MIGAFTAAGPLTLTLSPEGRGDDGARCIGANPIGPRSFRLTAAATNANVPTMKTAAIQINVCIITC